MENYMEILTKVSEHGMAVDTKKLAGFLDQFRGEISELQKDIPFKPTSNKDLGAYIVKMGYLPKGYKKGKTGAPSVAIDVLQPIYVETKDEILGKVIQAKKKIKTLGMLERLSEDTKSGRVFTHFTNDCSSGRIYTEGPSLQLMPLEARECIVPDNGNIFISADYAQEELRILAVACGDPKLLAAIENGEDLHTTVVWEMVPELKGKELTSEQRMLGKVLNYGIIYGMDAAGIARTLKVTPEQGQDLLEDYLDKFEGIKKWLQDTSEEIMKVGYAETLISKRQYKINYDNADQEKELRRAINHIIQGTAADILTKVIVSFDALLPGKLRMLTHDAVLVECSQVDDFATRQVLKTTMENIGAEYKQTVELKAGFTWREAMGK